VRALYPNVHAHATMARLKPMPTGSAWRTTTAVPARITPATGTEKRGGSSFAVEPSERRMAAKPAIEGATPSGTATSALSAVPARATSGCRRQSTTGAVSATDTSTTAAGGTPGGYTTASTFPTVSRAPRTTAATGEVRTEIRRARGATCG